MTRMQKPGKHEYGTLINHMRVNYTKNLHQFPIIRVNL